MPTDRQRESARRNGARSKGPVTPEGKAASSQNAVRHGIYSKSVVLACESQEDYDALLAELSKEYQPAGFVEAQYVRDIADARWRLQRIQAIETQWLDEMVAENQRRRKPNTVEHQVAEAWSDIARCSNKLELLARQESRLRRDIERAAKALRTTQADRRKAEAQQAPRVAAPQRTQKRRNEPAKVLSVISAMNWEQPSAPPEPLAHPRHDVPRSPECPPLPSA